MSETGVPASAIEERKAKEKAQFLEALKLKFGNVSEACKAVGLSRASAYSWRSEDETFAEEWNEVIESLKDFAESKLLLNISKGKEASIFFYLKCRAKDRGYIERVDVNHSGKLSLEDVLAESWKKKPDAPA
ncbi:MAG TPA: hypothetical protein PK416_07870 [Thermodesulfobacteriota bacterium]|nr:hypothetical protein [Thermodesulfobacteriota bacterium]